MPTYFLVADAESIVPLMTVGMIVINGKAKPLLCSKNIQDCFPAQTQSLHQLFILELNIPLEKVAANDSISIDNLQPNWIQKVNVHSLQGQLNLNNIFKSGCPKPVVTQPDLFSQFNQESQKRSASSPFFAKSTEPESSEKKARLDTAEKKPAPPQAGVSKQSYVSFERISTYDEHIKILQSCLQEAKYSLLITSYGINHETFQRANLFRLFADAKRRNVRIYIYYNDQKNIAEDILRFFEKNDIHCDFTWTHSKILAMDKCFVAAGSFNWLSTINSHYGESEEASFVCHGNICELIIDDFWKHLKHYRNQQFANNKRVKRFERNPYNISSMVYELDGTTNLTYLPTLDQHCGFLQDLFKQAKNRVIICSPFISSARSYAEDLNTPLLREATSRGVKVYFICSTYSNELGDFQDFLKRLRLPNIHLVTVTNMHLKTIIIDDSLIAEGSFNWLSASRNRDSEYHNHELTLLVEGQMAKCLIQHYFQTKLGSIIADKIGIPKQTPTVELKEALPSLAYK